MANKRIVITGTRGFPSYYGGFETAVRKLVPYLAERGWNVTIYSRDKLSSKKKINNNPKHGSINTVYTKGFDTQSLSTLSYGFSASIDAVKDPPNVALIMNTANGFFLPLLKAANIRTIVNVDGLEWERAKWGWLAKKIFKIGARLVAKYADEIIVDSKAIGDYWSKEFNRQGVFIPYGGEKPKKLDFSPVYESKKYILIACRLVPENTVHEFLIAAKTLQEKFPIVIVGSAGYKSPLEKSVKNLVEISSNITWLGQVKNDDVLHGLLQHAGVYFHGHSAGGTNPILVQAMACGSPIVALKTIFNLEVLGTDAAYVGPNPDEISYKISEVMENPLEQERLSKISRDLSQEKYTWESVCKQYLEAINGLLDEDFN